MERSCNRSFEPRAGGAYQLFQAEGPAANREIDDADERKKGYFFHQECLDTDELSAAEPQPKRIYRDTDEHR